MNCEKGLFRLVVVLVPVFGIVAMMVNNSFTGEVEYYESYYGKEKEV